MNKIAVFSLKTVGLPYFLAGISGNRPWEEVHEPMISSRSAPRKALGQQDWVGERPSEGAVSGKFPASA